MKIGIFLSYKGLGANLLHLSYCHEIAKKYGPVSIITLCHHLESVLKKDPLIKEVIYLNKFHKKLVDIINLSKFLKDLKLDSIFIFYPSFRYFLSSKIAGIKNINIYPLFKKKNLHLVYTAKTFVEKKLNITNCPTETVLHIDETDLKEKLDTNKKIIILGVGSSGPSTKWGIKNYTLLIKELNKKNDYFFYLLCGPEENNIAQDIMDNIKENNCLSLSKKNISEIIPILSNSKIYIGNDSFGHHVTSQRGIPSFIIMLDTPKAYSDYSKNQFRILPKNVNENDITHNSAFSADSITVEMIMNKIKKFI
jgi:ADP-heptose:LPS heptosyltransferase